MSWISCHLSGFVLLFMSQFWAQYCSSQAPLGGDGSWASTGAQHVLFGDQEDSVAMRHKKVGPTPGIPDWHAVLLILGVLMCNSSRSSWLFQWNLPWELDSCWRLALSWVWSFQWINQQFTPQWPVQEEQGEQSNAGPFLSRACLQGTWFSSVLGNLGSARKGSHSAGSEGRPGERQCRCVAAWKPRVALRFSINLHSVSNSSCVTPSSMAYGIVIHSQCKCLVLGGKLVIFYCRAQRWMSLPLFIPPPLLQECCITRQAQEAMAVLACPVTTWVDGNSEGYQFLVVCDFYVCFSGRCCL